MRRFLTHLHRHSHSLRPSPPPSRIPTTRNNLPFLRSRRLLSDDASPTDAAPSPPPPPAAEQPPTPPPSFADVPNAELKRRLLAYCNEDEGSDLSSVAEAVLQRGLADAHSETDDELIEELHHRPLCDFTDKEVQESFDETHEVNEELTDLYNARQYVEQKMKKEKFFNMDDTKWDAMTKPPTAKERLSKMKEYTKGQLREHAKKSIKEFAKAHNQDLDLNLDNAAWDDIIKKTESDLTKMSECEDTLEGMLQWDKLLPDEIKEKVEAKYNELEDMCEREELEPEQAYELFREFEDKMVSEYTEVMEAEPPTVDELSERDNKSVKLNDPPGAGPVLTWESTIVFAPGSAWHPKNRKVKLSVTVKELGLSRHAFRRLREVVGKRYNSGKDELTIISERFDHREENRKDCLRTLYALVEDAMKADTLADDARNDYVKERLKANSQFMDRLKTKTQKLRVAA